MLNIDILPASMLEPSWYCRLNVNNILRRLDHPAVSAVLHLKAFLHASTSGLLPDPLTGRTGVEEAKSLLTSGAAQPWQPLGGYSQAILSWINNLSPQRNWQYDLRSLQRVTWSPQSPLQVQDPAFNTIASDIVAQSVNLGHFTMPSIESANLSARGSSHLHARHQIRYSSGAHEIDPKTLVKDVEYVSQVGRPCANYSNAYRIATWVSEWTPTTLAVQDDLIGVLQNWGSFQGLNVEACDVSLLSDIINLDLPSSFGATLNMCRQCSGFADHWRYSVFFVLLGLNRTVDLPMVRTLLAFAIMSELRDLEPPQAVNYRNFRADQQALSLEVLARLIQPACISYDVDDTLDAETQALFSRKQLRILEQEKVRHEQIVDDQCRAFSRWIIR